MKPLSWLLPGAKISFHHSKDGKLLLTKKSDAEGKGKRMTLADLCREATPTTCQLNPFLFNGHLQTAWTTIDKTDIPIYYRRTVFEAENPTYQGHFAVDFVVPPYDAPSSDEETDKARVFTLPSGLPPRTAFHTAEGFAALPSDDNKPMLVVLHGLTGGSHEIYLRSVLAPLVLENGGWEACVINSRGCSRTKITSGVLFNARSTWDIRQTVKWLRKIFPNRPLFGIGFSLGANILTNYLGEEGEDCILRAAVICANPWNLDVTNLALQRTWLGQQVYAKVMGSNLKKLFYDHIDMLLNNPRIDLELVKHIKYIHHFDRYVQAPTWGYPSEGAYHRDASSVDSLHAIRIPFFAIQAEDDPISAKEALPFQEITQTPYGVMLTTSWGGHIGWFETGGSRWFAKPAANFLNTIAREIDLGTPFVLENAGKLYGKGLCNGKDTKKPGSPPSFEFDSVNRKLSMPIEKSI